MKTWITESDAMRDPGVYAIVCIVNGKRYVGSSAKSVLSRWKHHRHFLKSGRHKNKRLQADWNTHGESSFAIEILESCGPDMCVSREQFWMDLFASANEATGYNMSPSAGPVTGISRSAEFRQRVSDSRRGKALAPEHREKLRQALLGKKHSPERIEKCRQSRLGKSRNQETKDKIRATLTGRRHSPETIERIRLAKVTIYLTQKTP